MFFRLYRKHFTFAKWRRNQVSSSHRCCALFGRLFWAYLYIILIIWSLIAVAILVIYSNNEASDFRNEYIDFKLKSIFAQENYEVCVLPELPLNNSLITKYQRNIERIECIEKQPEWVTCSGDVCRVEESARQEHGYISCNFRELYWKTDTSIGLYHPKIQAGSSYILEKSDFARVQCAAEDGSKWKSLVFGLRKSASNASSQNFDWFNHTRRIPFNVLILGIGSLSRNDFIRKLPKTYRFLTANLNSKILRGFNILGDGKAAALIPFLTGMTEVELPEARQRIKWATSVDGFPLIWKNYKAKGYVTAFIEDVLEYSTFNYRLNGFKQQPVDHYLRTYLLAHEFYRYKFNTLCLGVHPRHQIALKYLEQFMKSYEDQPKFSVSFLGKVSDGYTHSIPGLDADLTRWLKDMDKSGFWQNTILIMMSDHGSQFENIRNSFEGKLEERLPFVSLAFPHEFIKEHPELYANFNENLNRLTTSFDVHATLLDIIGLQRNPYVSRRGISLFRSIPEGRSCADARIEQHWCACLSWQKLDLKKDPAFVMRLTDLVTHKMKQATRLIRNRCAFSSIHDVISIEQLIVRAPLLKYKGYMDSDGFQADFTGKTMQPTIQYKMKFSVIPSFDIFDVQLVHFVQNDSLDLIEIYRRDKRNIQRKCL